MKAPIINKTRDYSKFKFVEENRKAGSAKQLRLSIQTIDLTPYNPIIVDCNYNIIDGQHRFIACMDLNKPIYYVVMPWDVDSKSAMVMLNKAQDQWRIDDFLHFHAVTKGGCYQDLYEFSIEHKMGASNALVVYPKEKISPNQLKRGLILFQKSECADELVEFINSDSVRQLAFRWQKHFVVALRTAFETYTRKEIEKLKSLILLVPMCATPNQYMTVFGNIAKKKS